MKLNRKEENFPNCWKLSQINLVNTFLNMMKLLKEKKTKQIPF